MGRRWREAVWDLIVSIWRAYVLCSTNTFVENIHTHTHIMPVIDLCKYLEMLEVNIKPH